jgi:hypothetical protein
MKALGIELTPKRRYQRGEIVERSGIFYLRFYDNKLVGDTLKRTKVTERLVERDHKHDSIKSRAVKALAARRMVEINARQEQTQTARAMLVNDFAEKIYLPWVRANRRATTAHGYERTWKMYLKDHFEEKTISEYRTLDASQCLTALAAKLSRRPLHLARSLGSGVFRHAVNLGMIERNPWREAQPLVKVRKTATTKKYTLDEALALLEKINRTDAKVFFALTMFAGLMPSEVAALQWNDVEHSEDETWLRVNRSFVYGVVGETKTERRAAPVLLIEPVKSLLKAWHAECANVSKGWMFAISRKGESRPVDYSAFARRHIAPAAKLAGVEWAGLYAGRRGLGTVIAHLAPQHHLASAAVLRNTQETALKHYVGHDNEVGVAAFKLLEQRAAARTEELKKGK